GRRKGREGGRGGKEEGEGRRKGREGGRGGKEEGEGCGGKKWAGLWKARFFHAPAQSRCSLRNRAVRFNRWEAV
ncbi:MAG: hypothetical protein LBT40_16165, partial [Deltaproteobacteria bacterium]|nr:hypothetical protein [Deltaproteobacteria bacterium]